jgi:hypothetical protein
MKNKAFGIAQEAMVSLEMFRDFYASGESYQENFQEVLKILRVTAQGTQAERYSDAKFLLAFADALEVANRPGEYVPLGKR